MNEPFKKDGTQVVRKLELSAIPPGSRQRYWLNLVRDGVGSPIYLPVIVLKGAADGPVLGLTAAVHGDELNGIPVIQRLFREVDPGRLSGTLVGVPVVNIPSLHRKQRRFIDDVDLNDIMPGKKDGNVSEVYAHRFVHRIIRHLDYLVDLHTASFGRINSYYIRANLDDPVTRRMALLQNAQIIVHNRPSDGTLRGAAAELGIHAITLEVGDPNVFQRGLIRSGLTGVHNLMVDLGMLEDKLEAPDQPPVVCSRSYWIYTDTGGILTVPPGLADRLEAGQTIGILRNIFGDEVRRYQAPEAGVVVGKSVSPINQTGGRILHLGIEQA